MRALGVLLTVLSLFAVQAPWIVCGCCEDPTCAPILGGLFGHAAGDHEHDDDHDCCAHQHHCCDPAAHVAHGAHHQHGARCPSRARHEPQGVHCHGDYRHAHDEHGEPQRPEPSPHVGFHLPTGTMPPPVALDGAEYGLVLALILEADPFAARHVPAVARTGGPPGPPPAPGVATERLLL